MLRTRFPRAAGQPLVVGLGCLVAVAYTAFPHSAISELLLYQSVVVVAIALAVHNHRRAPAERRVASTLLVVSLVLFGLGEGVWWWYAAQGRDPYPSPADVFFLLGYVPLLALGLHLRRLQTRDGADRSLASIDALVLTVVVATVMWKFLMEPSALEPNLSLAERFVSLGYPTADIFVAGCALHLFLVRNRLETWVLVFSLGIAFTFAGDVSLAWTDMRGTYDLASWVDPLFPISYLLLAWSISLPSSVAPPLAIVDEVEDDDVAPSQFRAVALAALIPLSMVILELRDNDLLGVNSVVVSVFGLMVVTALFVWKARVLLEKARAAEIRRGASRLSEIVHNSVDAIVLVDADLRITYASAALELLIGVDADRCVGLEVGELIDEAARPSFEQHLRAIAASRPGSMVRLDSRIRVSGQASKDIEGSARNLLENPDVRAIVVTLRDVTARRDLEAQLERQAFHDSLTGLANRALFHDRVGHALTSVARSVWAGPAVIFLDLDDFKAINDGMGHGAGDELLKQVAGRLLACLRPSDTVARLGGDEFAVLVEHRTTSEEITSVAQRLLEVLRLPVQVGDLQLTIPASAGVALAHPECTAESLLQEADIAMYSAKAQGKGRLAVFDHGLREQAENRLALKHELPIALRTGQFRVDYQPIFETADGNRLRGVEALVRWVHPERGLIPPLDFIPLAEETGDIIELGRWILRSACLQAVAWNDRSDRPITVSVNVSAVQLHHPDFLVEVASALSATGLRSELLVLEITESMLADHELVEPILRSLRVLGIAVAIDDFGTGYSSLSYLQRLDVSSVKIDRSFIHALSTSQDSGLVRGILSIAEALSLSAVAEGVENAEQLTMLQDLDCTFVQGYHLSRPCQAADLDSLIGQAASAGRQALATPKPISTPSRLQELGSDASV